jgi:hypothetical protein
LAIVALRDHNVEGDEKRPSSNDKSRFDWLSNGLEPRSEILECQATSKSVQGGNVEHRPDDGPASDFDGLQFRSHAKLIFDKEVSMTTGTAK